MFLTKITIPVPAGAHREVPELCGPEELIISASAFFPYKKKLFLFLQEHSSCLCGAEELI
jgi:hypothetical protein